VACTHLSLTEEDRMASIGIIAREAERWQKPFFLMGDLNDEPGTPFYHELSSHFRILTDTSQPTFPSTKPNICIDYIVIDKSHEAQVASVSSRVGTEKFSDHCPLHATLQLK
jgi:endonuclease/exonuclease/phosphatase family metal-dependent hydrolase